MVQRNLYKEIDRDGLHVVVLGLNHITASVDFRDRAHFSREEIAEVTELILKESDFHEVVVLSTCNRSEIYAVTSRNNGRELMLRHAWAEIKNIQKEELKSQSYYCRDSKAIKHLFRVICSLDSMVVGENQILGQVKSAYDIACKNNSVDFYFNFLFQLSFRVGKRVRSETKLNEGAVSISSAAVELVQKVLGKKFKERTVGVIGSGEMGELTAFHLNKAGVTKFIFFNRSLNNVEKLAARFGGDVHRLSHLEDRLSECDIVISSTGARETVVSKEQVEKAIRTRNGKPMLLMDIAAPRDIEENVQDVQNTFLFTIDDIKSVVGQNQVQRQEAANSALKIINEETEKVESWHANLDLVSIIQSLREKYEHILQQELRKKSGHKSDKESIELEKICRTLMGKFLHVPISGLKQMSLEGGGKRAGQYASQIFSIPHHDKM